MPKVNFATGLEPAAYDERVFQVLSPAYDGLVTYPRVGGSTYGRLVAGLATHVPEPSPDGKTYVFKLRPGIRFWNGALVQPEDVRASLEGVLRRTRQHPYGPSFYEHIVGAPVCRKRPARCDLSKGITTDAAARTVTFHLTRPDPEILHKLAYPFAYVVPARSRFGSKVLPPGTGPYRIASFDPARGVRLVRNRHFRVWSQDARPDGLADDIRVQLRDLDAQLSAVERGASDVVLVAGAFGGPLSSTRIAALAARYPGRLHTDAVPETDYMFLNVRTPPFDDVRVRRAINYAVDRREIGRRAGGADLARPTCQMVPPGFPGYAPSCRYTIDPNPSGGWSGPDTARARRLIEQSGTKGMKVTVWIHADKRPIARYFASLLEGLGYHSSLRSYPNYFVYSPRVSDSRTRAQIGINGFSSDYATPSTFIEPFRCEGFIPRSAGNRNVSGFCDRRIEHRIDAALAVRGPEADAIWQDVYRLLADAAPAVPLVHRRVLALVSKRVGNYRHHPQWGPLYEQMWVR